MADTYFDTTGLPVVSGTTALASDINEIITETNTGFIAVGTEMDRKLEDDSTDTLTNKTIVVASNTITTAASGNLAATELNAALAELDAQDTTLQADINVGRVGVRYIGEFSNDLAAAVAAIGSTETTLVINTDVDTAGTPVTQPSTLAFEFTRAGSIDDSVGGGTLTLNGDIIAGRWTIFGPSITLAGTPKTSYFYPEWKGAVGDDTVDDDEALHASFDFIADKGITLDLAGVTYKYTTYLVIPNCTIRGQGREASILNLHGNGAGAWVKGDKRVEMSSFRMLVASAYRATNVSSGFINPPSTNDAVTDAPNDPDTGLPYRGGARVHASDVQIDYFGKDGFRVNNGNISYYEACYAYGNKRNGMSLGGADANGITIVNFHPSASTAGAGFTHNAKLDDGTDAGNSYNTTIQGGYAAYNDVGWEIDGNGNCIMGIGGESNTTYEYSILANTTRSFIHYLGGSGFKFNNAALATINTIVSSTLTSSLRFPSLGLFMDDGAGGDWFRMRRSGSYDYLESLGGMRLTVATAAFADGGIVEIDSAGNMYPNPSLSGDLGTASYLWGSLYTGGIKSDLSTTAGQTRILVYDVDNATFERVTVGAADSGGAGYKVLRIPN